MKHQQQAYWQDMAQQGVQASKYDTQCSLKALEKKETYYLKSGRYQLCVHNGRNWAQYIIKRELNQLSILHREQSELQLLCLKIFFVPLYLHIIQLLGAIAS